MNRIRFRPAPSRLLAGLSCAAALVVSGRLWLRAAAAAPETGTNEPASEGRPITPAGVLLMDASTRRPAVVPLTVDFVRSTDEDGPDGRGRYLIAVNSGYGVQFSADTNRGQQSLSVIDLGAAPAPVVIQNVYFPAPQSAGVGVALSRRVEPDGGRLLYVSGGVENKVWTFRFTSGADAPIAPGSPGPRTRVEAEFIDVSGFTARAATPRYNGNFAPVYPAGLALSPDGDTLFVANNLDDSLGIISHLRGARDLTRVDLRRDDPLRTIYPYGVAVLPARDGKAAKVYVSCWNDAALAVVDPRRPSGPVRRIVVDRHPTAMTVDLPRKRLYVVNSDADTVSVIDTRLDREIERISVRLAENARPGSSPEGLALSPDGTTLFVANAHSNAVAVVALE